MTFVYRRPAKGLLGGLIAFPSQGWDDKRQGFDPNWRPFKADWVEIKPVIRHVFTHFKAEIKVFVSQVETTNSKNWDDAFQPNNETNNEQQDMPEFEWISEADLHLPKLMEKALQATTHY